MPHYGSGEGPLTRGLSGAAWRISGPARWQSRDTMRPAPAGAVGAGARARAPGSAPPRRRPLRRDTRRDQATRIVRPKRIFDFDRTEGPKSSDYGPPAFRSRRSQASYGSASERWSGSSVLTPGTGLPKPLIVASEGKSRARPRRGAPQQHASMHLSPASATPNAPFAHGSVLQETGPSARQALWSPPKRPLQDFGSERPR